MSNWKEHKYVIAAVIVVIAVIISIIILLNKDIQVTDTIEAEELLLMEQTESTELVEEGWTTSESTLKLVEDITDNLTDENYTEPFVIKYDLITFEEAYDTFTGTFPLESIEVDSGFNWGEAQAVYNAYYDEVVVFDDVLSIFMAISDLNFDDLKYSVEGPSYYISDWDYNFAMEDSNTYYTFFVKDNVVGYYIDIK